MPWSAWIHTGFHVYGATQDSTRAIRILNYGTVTRYGRSFQSVRLIVMIPRRGPTTPEG
jgi:hypothetical protein